MLYWLTVPPGEQVGLAAPVVVGSRVAATAVAAAVAAGKAADGSRGTAARAAATATASEEAEEALALGHGNDGEERHEIGEHAHAYNSCWINNKTERLKH